VDIRIDVEIAAIHVDEKEAVKTTKVLSAPIIRNGYDIDSPKALDHGDLADQQIGWFPGVPRSHLGGGGRSVGTFTLKVMVTERDPSNAPRILEYAAKQLEENEKSIVDRVREAIEDGNEGGEADSQ
jgi:hypothetical protein